MDFSGGARRSGDRNNGSYETVHFSVAHRQHRSLGVITGRLLSTVESDRLVALIAVFENPLTLFEDDVTAATEWMNSPARGLGSKRPLEMLRTRVEARAVFDLIGGLGRGVLV